MVLMWVYGLYVVLALSLGDRDQRLAALGVLLVLGVRALVRRHLGITGHPGLTLPSHRLRHRTS